MTKGLGKLREPLCYRFYLCHHLYTLTTLPTDRYIKNKNAIGTFTLKCNHNTSIIWHGSYIRT